MSIHAAYCVCGECILLTDKQWNEFHLRKHPFSPLYSAYVIEPVQLATARKSSSITAELDSQETISALPSVCSLFYGILRDRSGPVYIRHDSRKYEKMFRYKCPHCELMIAYSQDPNHPAPLYLMTSMVRLEEEERGGDDEKESLRESASVNESSHKNS